MKESDIHILFDENSQQIFCKDLKVGQSIQTKFGLVPVKKIVELGRKQSMFDLSIDHPEHRFFTNGILSHNTINAAITMLHFITFNNDKNIMNNFNKLSDYLNKDKIVSYKDFSLKVIDIYGTNWEYDIEDLAYFYELSFNYKNIR